MKNSRWLLVRSGVVLSKLLNLFWFLLVETGDFVVGVSMSVQQFIKFGMDRLSISMFSALDEQSHQPCREGGKAVPLQRLRAEE